MAGAAPRAYDAAAGTAAGRPPAPHLHDWLEDLIERPDRRRRHANVACETCLVEVPCP